MKQLFLILALVAFIAVPSKAQKADKTSQTCTFSVNMDCQNCVDKITKQLSFEKGVRDLNISLENGTVAVTFRPDKTDKEHLESSIKKLGYEVKEVKKEEEKKEEKVDQK